MLSNFYFKIGIASLIAFFIILWGSFWLWNTLNIDGTWYQVPFIITVIIGEVFSGVIAVIGISIES